MLSKKPIRIAIASDQPIFLRGLSTLVMSTPGAQLVGEARSASEAYQLAELVEPDILLLDCKRVLVLGRDVAMAILEKRPSVKIGLLVAPAEEAELKQRPIEEGLYYISREVTEEELRGALSEMFGLSEQHPPGAQTHNLFGHARDGDADDELANIPPAQIPRSNAVMTRELEMAGKIQADILPEEAPVFPGWEVAARLEPARETSGDFYDFIPLTASKWAIVVADVTDKGMGAALFMALSSSLIRTYATRFPTLPALTVNAVSGRILSDTHGSMFVTALFGVLEPDTGRFIYANAGHPPGYLITTTPRGESDVERLRPTGMALGVSEQAQWRQKIVRMSPGDILLLYTDGITEAQNAAGEFFGEEHLLDCVLAKKGCSAEEVLQALLDEVHRFVGSTPRQDDIALVVVRRKP